MVAPSFDLLAALRPVTVTVTVAGHPFALEAATAAQWIGAIAMDTENLYGIVPGLIRDEDLEVMYQLMQDHPDIETRWRHAARTALGRGGGRDWWWSKNLSTKALGSWMYINGVLLRQGVDAKKTNFPDWLDACYTMLWQLCDEEHQIKLDFQLCLPPPGVSVHQSAASTRKMSEAFAAD